MLQNKVFQGYKCDATTNIINYDNNAKKYKCYWIDDKQPQSNMVQYDELPPPPAYQEQYETLPMPHAPLQGFSQHSYPQDTMKEYPLGQEPSLAETLVGYPPEHIYESIDVIWPLYMFFHQNIKSLDLVMWFELVAFQF